MILDCDLLGRYAETQSEDAFAELVRRLIKVVYSTAMWQVNNFIGSLRPRSPLLRVNPSLPGFRLTFSLILAVSKTRRQSQQSVQDVP
jgi:hypothetical protein